MESTNIQMTEGMPVVTQVTAPEPQIPTLADVIGDQAGGQEQVQPPAPSTESAIPQKEPGWYKDRVAKDRAKWEAENNAKMAPVLSQLAQLQEYRLGVEADKLVASGKITDRDMAIEYLRNKEGIPAPAASTPPRDERGRFTSPNTPAPQTEVPNEVQQRANELYAQAKTLQKYSGVDVMGVYRSNPAFAEKVNSGEWDMADVLRASQEGAPAQQARTPAPVRASNGNGIGSANFMNMTSEAFAKVNEELRKGGRIDMQTY